jgi:hypothetical protein
VQFLAIRKNLQELLGIILPKSESDNSLSMREVTEEMDYDGKSIICTTFKPEKAEQNGLEVLKSVRVKEIEHGTSTETDFNENYNKSNTTSS